MVTEIKQDTVPDIIESEYKMILNGEERYGEFFIHVSKANELISAFIKSIDPDRYIFAIFLSQVKKHLLLAQFSALRLHHIQTCINLRQALEAGSWAAYAIGNIEKDKFCEEDEKGFLTWPEKFKITKNAWLAKFFPDASYSLKRQIKSIGDTTGHSNIVYAHNNFKFSGDVFETPFFDFEDGYRVKTDLWQIANIAYGLMDLFYGVYLKFGGIKFSDQFIEGIKALKKENDILKKAQMDNPRYKKYVNT